MNKKIEFNKECLMRILKHTEMEKACCEIIDVLEKYEITIESLDRLLLYVKQMAYFNTPIQNYKIDKYGNKID